MKYIEFSAQKSFSKVDSLWRSILFGFEGWKFNAPLNLIIWTIWNLWIYNFINQFRTSYKKKLGWENWPWSPSEIWTLRQPLGYMSRSISRKQTHPFKKQGWKRHEKENLALLVQTMARIFQFRPKMIWRLLTFVPSKFFHCLSSSRYSHFYSRFLSQIDGYPTVKKINWSRIKTI